MNIKTDSRKVVPGDTFVAIIPANDGHKYVEDAIKNGATKVVVEEGLYSVETLVVKDTHEYLINYLKDNYYNEIKDLKIIGVTGTNGKTTTCYLLYQILNNVGKKCGYIGTIGFYINDKIKDLNNTTSDVLEIYEMLIECKNQNCEYVVMEVSSHALAMNRVKGLEFDYAIFTNLTQDHLDYHKTMDNYANEKKKLFSMLRKEKIAIVNYDDEAKNNFIIEGNKTITYGLTGGDYNITKHTVSPLGSNFTLNGSEYEMKLLGKHNLYNIMCVIILLNCIGIEENTIKEQIKDASAPTGRMDTIKKGDNVIIVDYAHTPDAVLNIINAARELNPNHVYTLVGCGGNRDKTKRPIMASIATELSDYCIFTSDNPRCEEPDVILNDMIRDLERNNYEIIVNRKEAIIKGIQLLDKNDILLVLGKGHETYQIIGTTKYDFDDKKIIIENI